VVGRKLTGPFCWPPAVAAGAYCGWLIVLSGEGEGRLCSLLWQKWSVGLHLNMHCARLAKDIGTRLVFGDLPPPFTNAIEV
jgi:hypothetical protein